MSSYNVYTLDREQLEEMADKIKLVVLNALVEEGRMTFEEADKWCKEHTIIQKKKTFFRTLSDLWTKTETVKDAYYWVIVKLVKREEGNDEQNE